MSIFVYGDESGVFDHVHNDYFVFGGLIFLDKNARDTQYRKFISAERKIAPLYSKAGQHSELKAARLKGKHKAGLFRSTNGCIRYAMVIDQKRVHKNIFSDKKSKQRFLDYVYKVGLKRTFEVLIDEDALDPSAVDHIHIRFDEHTTATNGRYELREGIEEEVKRGTFNYNFNVFHEPIFPDMSGQIELTFKDSKNDALIRASDIIANHVFYKTRMNALEDLEGKVILTYFP